jgi:hypothetical protein
LKVFLLKEEQDWDVDKHQEVMLNILQGKWRNPGTNYFESMGQVYAGQWKHEDTWDFFHRLACMNMKDTAELYVKVRRILRYAAARVPLCTAKGPWLFARHNDLEY